MIAPCHFGLESVLKKEIIDIIENKPFTKENCLKRARQYNMVDKFNEYVELYDEMLA